MSRGAQVDDGDGSGPHQSRLPRAVKLATTTAAGAKHAVAAFRPSTPPSSSSLQGPRRKRTTDQAFSTDHDFENAPRIPKRILRPRTTSISLSLCLSVSERLFRPTKAAASKATASKASLATTVNGHERDRVPLSDISSAGAPWKQHLKIQSKIPILSRSTVIKRLHKPGADTTIQKATPTPLPLPPAILSLPERAFPSTFPANILDADLFPGEPQPLLTEYFAFSFDDALDDLARWDMAALPSIPSPPTSPGFTSTPTGDTIRDDDHTTTHQNPPLPAPFSDPIDDDVLLETAFPFLHRTSKVVRENMGVKKPRALARTKSCHTLAPFGPGAGAGAHPVFPAPFEQSLPGLPHPLPLRTLCQNTTAPNPLLGPRAHVMSKTVASLPRRATGPATTWRDSYGSIHLGAVDCALSLAFDETSHFEFWDADDDAILPCPVLLCLLAKDSYPWTGRALALPDVTLFDLRVEDIPGPSARLVQFSPADQFSVQHTSTRIQLSSSSSSSSPAAASPAGGRLTFDPFVVQGGKPEMRGEGLGLGQGRAQGYGQSPGVRIDRDEITVEPKWIRTYTRPGVPAPSTATATATGQAPPMPPRRATDPIAVTTTTTTSDAARGWYLKFWVPVPARLFAKRETRVFRVHARVWMNGDEERALRLDGGGALGVGATPSGLVGPAGDGDGGGGGRTGAQGVFPLVAEARMTVSHLRSPREMDAWY